MKPSPAVLAEMQQRQEQFDPNLFVSYGGNSSTNAMTAYGKAIDVIEPIRRTSGAISNQYRNIDSNTSVRSGFSRLDYEFFRPSEQVPRMQKQAISACMAAYDRIGIVRNIIDTMADFACQGIRWTHPNRQVEEFYNSWFRRIDGADRSERFLNLLYRSGNVLVKRSRTKLKEKVVQDFKRGIAQEHLAYEDDLESVNYREIPLTYTFLNPMSVDVMAEELSAFTGKFYYKIKIPPRLLTLIQSPRNEYEVDMVKSIPKDIVDPIRAGNKEIRISDDDLIVYHYKKDDWQVWANPMTYAILDDLITLEKMKLADLAALDGAISHIRIWKLGSLEHKILPTDAAISKLSDLLLNNVGGGSMDLIWGPDLVLDETSTEIHRFLGSTKYETCLTNIYAGLGVPPTMTGSSQGGGGFNNNFISLKTLMERLKYGRGVLSRFWQYESRMVQKAMRFKEPATLLYDQMNMSDEVSDKALWIQLVDRMVISEQSLQERFGTIPEVERRRLDKEYGRRRNRKMPPKASPFHDANPDLSLEKIFAQRGAVTPSELGLVLEEREPGEKTGMEIQQEQQDKQLEVKLKGQPGQGRPRNAKDSQKRKSRTVKVSKASEDFVGMSVWAYEAQKAIADITTPFFLQKFEKENARQFTVAEIKEMENFKFTLLSNTPAYSSVTEEEIYNLIQNPLSVYSDMNEAVNAFAAEVVERRGTEPNLDEIRKIQCLVYAMYKGEFDESNSDNG